MLLSWLALSLPVHGLARRLRTKRGGSLSSTSDAAMGKSWRGQWRRLYNASKTRGSTTLHEIQIAMQHDMQHRPADEHRKLSWPQWNLILMIPMLRLRLTVTVCKVQASPCGATPSLWIKGSTQPRLPVLPTRCKTTRHQPAVNQLGRRSHDAISPNQALISKRWNDLLPDGLRSRSEHETTAMCWVLDCPHRGCHSSNLASEQKLLPIQGPHT